MPSAKVRRVLSLALLGVLALHLKQKQTRAKQLTTRKRRHEAPAEGEEVPKGVARKRSKCVKKLILKRQAQAYAARPLPNPSHELQNEPAVTTGVKKRILKRRARPQAYAARPVPNLCHHELLNEPAGVNGFAKLFPTQVQKLAELVAPFIRKQNTNFRDSISVEERLMVTLRFLATGENFSCLSNKFQMGLSTVSKFVPETCGVIYEVLKEKYLKCPDTMKEWQQVSDEFQAKWNFPNCLGALDGRRINIRPPPKSGYIKYSYSIMALVDSDYKFLYVDVGCNGSLTDDAFAGCTTHDALERRMTSIPVSAPLSASDHQPVPYITVADQAFPLKDYIMTPYPNSKPTDKQRVFNYRLSRARRVAENAFGVLASRFQVLLTTINLQEAVVLACCALHNFLCTEGGDLYLEGVIDREGPDGVVVPGSWRQKPVLEQDTQPRTSKGTTRAKQHREALCRYFSSDVGAVPFQWDKI